MYDMDTNDPWDWTDYVRVWLGLIIVLSLVVGIFWVSYWYVPDVIDTVTECCQCCCP